ncbi:MAG: family 16 glycosylhydrolase [Cytophagaceae bacterium]
MKTFPILILSLIISFSAYSKKFKGAEVRTFETYTYGKFEVRMKAAKGSGMLCSFFTFYDEPDFPQNWNEIDIEFLGKLDDQVQFNSIIGHHTMNEHKHKLGFNHYDDFHLYGFEWYPDSILWFVDGKKVYSQSDDRIKNMNQHQKIMMNIWGWTGRWDEEILPVYAYYDFVKYYEYTPEKAETFTLKWVDEFKMLDESKWQKATHTFKENTSDFVHENALVRDGYLILCLTKENETGYKGGKIIDNSKVDIQISSAKTSLQKPSLIELAFKNPIKAEFIDKKYFHLEGAEIDAISTTEKANVLQITTTTELQAKGKYFINYRHPLNSPGKVRKKIKVTK